MTNLKPKISIVGCGNVGTRFAYVLTIKGLARHIVMVDIDKKRVEGEVMDISHGAPYVSPVKIDSGDYPDIKDSDIVVITAGRNQRPSETRIDLIKDNILLYEKIIPEIMEFAPSAKFLIVSNPVDILSYAAYKISEKPENEILGSGTVLDTARFRYLLGNKCNVNPRNIHAYILGEHGDSEFPVWSSAMIGGMLIKNYCLICNKGAFCDNQKELSQIFEEVKNSAYKIIERKGETSYGIGLALAQITQAILHDENTILPVSSLVRDFLGINQVYLSLPAIINKLGVSHVLKIALNPIEEDNFKKSAQKLRILIEQVGLG
ncbi:MAG: L-lactate dehydrogenase [Promethearchaeota archaeon]|jgi:L-lactate dehydrogenase